MGKADLYLMVGLSECEKCELFTTKIDNILDERITGNSSVMQDVTRS